MSTPVETFRVEAYERLAELESSLLELEESPDNEELVGQIFRALHTIKGSGAMFGFDDIASFTHEVETVFDMVRNGKLSVEKELIDLTLKAGDLIHALLDGRDAPERDALTASFKQYLPDTGERKTKPAKKQVEEEPVTYRIRFRPEPDIFASGTNPLPLLNELRQLGDASVIAQLDAIPSLEDMSPELCYTYWDIVLTTDKGENAIKDVFIFVEDLSEITIETVEEDKLLGEIMLERGDVKKEDLERVLKEKKPLGELLVDAGLVSKDKVASALAEQTKVKEAKQKKEDPSSSIRVAAEKLDKLVNLVGELVTVQARLTQKSSMEKDADLTLIAEEVERLTEELRDTTMSIRMLPIGTTFSKFKRLVRDLSSELGKKIDLTTEGGGRRSSTRR